MSDRFELFRLSLIERKQASLFSETVVTRAGYLRKVFGADWDFQHYGNTFYYRPSASALHAPDVIIGRLGRQYSTTENLPPDQDFEATQHEGWKAAVILIDPTHHADGQKVAMNYDVSVGNPSALIHALAKAVNTKDQLAPYEIIAERIFDSASFWQFADENKGDIVTLAFDFATPNMFGSTEELEAELKDISQQERAHRVTLRLKSADGIETGTTRVKSAVQYSEKGAGTIRARTRKGRSYNSKKKAKSVKLEPSGKAGSLLSRAVEQIQKIFSS